MVDIAPASGWKGGLLGGNAGAAISDREVNTVILHILGHVAPNVFHMSVYLKGNIRPQEPRGYDVQTMGGAGDDAPLKVRLYWCEASNGRQPVVLM